MLSDPLPGPPPTTDQTLTTNRHKEKEYLKKENAQKRVLEKEYQKAGCGIKISRKKNTEHLGY